MSALFSPNPRRRTFLLVAAAGLAACVAGCGRRGDLEPPSANAVQSSGGKHEIARTRPSQTITPPKKDFVLDPLLQ